MDDTTIGISQLRSSSSLICRRGELPEGHVFIVEAPEGCSFDCQLTVPDGYTSSVKRDENGRVIKAVIYPALGANNKEIMREVM